MAPVSGRLKKIPKFTGRQAPPSVTQPAHTATPVVTVFEGGAALSDFRVRQLLPKLQAIEPKIQGLDARFVQTTHRASRSLNDGGFLPRRSRHGSEQNEQ